MNDNKLNREVAAVTDAYVGAMQARDAERVLALVADDYFEDLGNADSSDDYGRKELAKKLTERFEQTAETVMKVQLIEVESKGDSVMARCRPDVRYLNLLSEPLERHNDVNETVLTRTGGGLKIKSGLQPMRASRFLLATAKRRRRTRSPSHVLMMRSGMIRKVAAGIYTTLPLGLRTLRKVERIVREELDRSGCLEVTMPMVIPAEPLGDVWRWQFYGPELLRLKDRKGGDFCLGPTHEEVITTLAAGEIKSYRRSPLNLYQVQTKFRDEIRPRFGLMAGVSLL